MTLRDDLETLRQVNEYLRTALIRFRPERRHCSAIKPRDFSDVRGQLRQAAECLRRLLPSQTGSEIEKESLEYRGNLENLKRLLPDVHARLLAEKSRLETAQTHVKAATAWERANRYSL
jgi:hypothetical protein